MLPSKVVCGSGKGSRNIGIQCLRIHAFIQPVFIPRRPLHCQKKGTKAITGAVHFQKGKLLSILGINMDILGANMDILGANMYILGANIYILGAIMYI